MPEVGGWCCNNSPWLRFFVCIKDMREKDALIARLDAFIRKFYLNELLRGGLIGLGLLVGYFLLITVLEHFGRFSGFVRMGLFWSFVALNISVFAWFILRPLLGLYRLGKHLSYEDAARLIGRHFRQEVDDRLLNTLELKHSAGAHASPLLLAAIEQRTQRLQTVPFAQAIDLGVNRRFLWFTLPVLLTFLALWLAKPQIITESTTRIVSYNQTFLPPAPFSFIIENEALKTAAHEDFTLKVRLEGNEIPEQLYLNESAGMYRMQSAGTGLFMYTFSHPAQTLSFHLSSGDFRSQDYTLQVVQKPLLRQLKARLTYPKYLDMKPEWVNDKGELVVPEGTRIDWEMDWQATDAVEVIWPDTTKRYSPDSQGKLRFNRTAMQGFDYVLVPENKDFIGKDSLTYRVSVIADEHPQIQVDAWKDTISFNRLLFNGSASDDYGITEVYFAYKVQSKGSDKSVYERQKISIPKGQQQVNFQLPFGLKNLNLEEGQELWYYFEAWDNDGAGGRKYSRTPLEKHQLPSRKELSQMQQENRSAIKEGLQEQQKAVEELNKSMEDFKRDMLEKKELGFEEKQKLKELMERRKALEKSLDKMQQLQKENSQRNQELSPEQQNILDKQKKIEELFEQLKDKGIEDLFEQLDKAMEQMDKNKLQELMEQMEMSQEEVERELDRTLELFKQFEVEQMLQEQINRLEELAKKQQDLAADKEMTAEEKENAQEELNKEAKEIQKELEELEKKNEALEQPKDLEDTGEEMDDISKEMEEAKEELDQKNESGAQKKQKSAAQKMKDLAQKMKEQQQTAAAQQQGENMEDLRALLENIVQLSFDQEQVMEQAKTSRGNDAVMRNIARDQRRIISDAAKVEDSLHALSKRVIELENYVMEELSRTKRGMEGALDHFAQRQYPSAWSRQQEAMTGFNNLALILSEALEQMMQQMQSMGSQSGAQCNKPGQSKPDKMSDLIQRQLGLQKKLEEMEQKMRDQQKKGPQQGKQDGGKGEGGQGSGEQAKRLAQMAAEQEQIRREMEEMLKDMSEEGRKQAGEAIKKMEETETDILNRRISAETVRRQKEITRRMLESERAQREQEEDEKRESRENVEEWAIPEDVLQEYLKKKEREAELLRTVPPALKPYYKQKVSDYFNQYP